MRHVHTGGLWCDQKWMIALLQEGNIERALELSLLDVKKGRRNAKKKKRNGVYHLASALHCLSESYLQSKMVTEAFTAASEMLELVEDPTKPTDPIERDCVFEQYGKVARILAREIFLVDQVAGMEMAKRALSYLEEANRTITDADRKLSLNTAMSACLHLLGDKTGGLELCKQGVKKAESMTPYNAASHVVALMELASRYYYQKNENKDPVLAELEARGVEVIGSLAEKPDPEKCKIGLVHARRALAICESIEHEAARTMQYRNCYSALINILCGCVDIMTVDYEEYFRTTDTACGLARSKKGGEVWIRRWFNETNHPHFRFAFHDDAAMMREAVARYQLCHVAWAMGVVGFQLTPDEQALVTRGHLGLGKSCNHCRRVGLLKTCGRCRVVGYCSRVCQSADWKRHKIQCTMLCKLLLDRQAIK